MSIHALYGSPPAGLCEIPAGARQCSPLVPGSLDLENPGEALASLTMYAPPGTIERRYALALALRAMSTLAPGTALAPKDKGGSRIGKELEAFGCVVEEDSKQHHKICRFQKPAALSGIDEALREGAPRFLEALQLHTQPGVFSWDRLDSGSLLLLECLPAFEGRGADLGAGLGVLSRKILESKKVKQLHLAELDGRAVRAARKNITDARTVFHWCDVRNVSELPANLDFVVSNPPFHDTGAEDRSLGITFIKKSAALLRAGGVCWLVANRHLPYEQAMQEAFSNVKLAKETSAFKVFEAFK
jgi:16S rRNA (guanine1207-N2)-methyltransferase